MINDIKRLKQLSGITESNEQLDEISSNTLDSYNDRASTVLAITGRQLEILTAALTEISKFKEKFGHIAQPAIDKVQTIIDELEATYDERASNVDVARQKMKDKGADMTGYKSRKNPPGSTGWKKGVEPAGRRRLNK